MLEMDLGSPGLAEQRAKEKLDRIYRRYFRILMLTVALLGAFSMGYQTRMNATEAKHRAEVVQQEAWKARNAMYVPMAKRGCAMEWREGCLVCQHRSLGGKITSTMC